MAETGGLRRSLSLCDLIVYDLARSALGPGMATLLAVTKAIGPAFAAMTAQAASARLSLGMARDGRLPAALGGIVTAWVIAESGPMAKAVGFAWLILGILVMAVNADKPGAKK